VIVRNVKFPKDVIRSGVIRVGLNVAMQDLTLQL